MEIYYDPTDGVLLAQNSQGEWGIVKTNAQLDPQRIALDAEGFMYIAGLNGEPRIITDFNGNPISLIGPPGKDGFQGKDGENGQDGVSPKVNLLDDGTLEIQDAFHTIVANVKGPKGDVGEKGGMGEKGADGLTFTPSISEDGVLSWTNSGDVLNPQPISIKGPKGDQGETGAQGPQGEKGEKGETGPQGEKGADGQTPVFEIADGSLKYKVGDQDWTNLITDKSIFTQPDIQTELPNEPTDGQIILWEGNPSMETDVRLTPGCKYQYLAAGTVLKNTRLIGKAPNSESYTVFKLKDASTIPSFSLYDIKKEILTSADKVVTLQGIYSKLVLEEGQTSLVSLQTIYDDGGKGFMSKITNSDQVKALIDANPTETYWAVVELEEVLESGVWIQIS